MIIVCHFSNLHQIHGCLNHISPYSYHILLVCFSFLLLLVIYRIHTFIFVMHFGGSSHLFFFKKLQLLALKGCVRFGASILKLIRHLKTYIKGSGPTDFHFSSVALEKRKWRVTWKFLQSVCESFRGIERILCRLLKTFFPPFLLIFVFLGLEGFLILF